MGQIRSEEGKTPYQNIIAFNLFLFVYVFPSLLNLVDTGGKRVPVLYFFIYFNLLLFFSTLLFWKKKKN